MRSSSRSSSSRRTGTSRTGRRYNSTSRGCLARRLGDPLPASLWTGLCLCYSPYTHGLQETLGGVQNVTARHVTKAKAVQQ